MLRLRHDTPREWVAVALADFDAFLQDHAANERKVAMSALTLAVQHPDKQDLVAALIAVSREELEHFQRVYELLRARDAGLAHDARDPYMSELRRRIKQPDVAAYLLDRLVLFGVIEARGCERFRMLHEALPDGPTARFYGELVASEARHHALYLDLARRYFPADRVAARLDALLDVEAEVARRLPLRPALH